MSGRFELPQAKPNHLAGDHLRPLGHDITYIYIFCVVVCKLMIEMKQDEAELVPAVVAQGEPDFDKQVFFWCCSGSKCDRRALIFAVTAFLTIVCSFFSMFQLYSVDKCNNEVYVSLLTLCLSVWFPAPSLNSKNNMQ